MSFSTSIAENIQSKMSALLEMVSGENRQSQTAHEVEQQLWWEMLLMGQQLMQLFFATCETQEARQKVYEVDGVEYVYAGQRKRKYVSLFGDLTVGRAYYWRKGVGGQCPLDDQLSLPERSFSDLVQERIGGLSVMVTYQEAVTICSKWLGWNLPKRCAEQINADHAAHVADYYEAKTVPDAPARDEILVVSADGKGIPMTRKDSPPPQARRGRGEKKTAKKEATVTTLYTIAPYKRDAEDIIRALVPGYASEQSSLTPRPEPTHKQVFGTLSGQKAAFEQLSKLAENRDWQHISHYVALTDGNRGLKNRVQQDLPDFTLIVDIIHVTEYLWEAANTLWGETHSMRQTWMRDALRCLLEYDLDHLLNHLHYQLGYLSKRKRTVIEKIIQYLENNRDYLDYQTYLAHGYPIGTGVIEGACRHLVKDRFERAGMRWSLDGAQVMLDLRAVYLNGDWDDFQRSRRRDAHQKRYRSLHPDAVPEELMMDIAS
ncbi:MAG: ISKra4 family transposase [Anaerolineaceae bacterium]|nr:MAG: ISKra4 family transposase [Anaerolineaceae bacterium]